ncbi:MAG: TetR/AcrR family transcriptional regulator [Anaerolineales bacterium]|nr:TetR/AcrR family transcriptional regulator [Anaerolineales bacterium]
MPRQYKMQTRSMATEKTKERIVQAAKELHASQGLQGTSYIEIADKAGVAMATVYRHFPSIADLIPACASSIVVLQTLTPDAVIALFQGKAGVLERLEWIIQGTCECYERDSGWLQAARREGDLIPTLSEVIDEQQKNLRILVRAALEESNVTERQVQVLAALMDFPLWKSLRDMGLTPDEATDQVLELTRDYLIKENLSA